MDMNQNFTFTYNYHYDGDISQHSNNKEVVINLNGEQNVTQLLTEFMTFLKACNYSFHIDDYLDVCNDHQNQFVDTSQAPQTDDEEFDSERDTYDSYWAYNSLQKQKDLSDEEIEWNNSFNVSEEDQFKPEDHLELSSADDSEKTISNSKLKELKDSIIPFLESLKQDSEKTIIRWPNRVDVVDAQIKKINDILGE